MVLSLAVLFATSVFGYACYVTGDRQGRQLMARVFEYELNDCIWQPSIGHMYQHLTRVIHRYK